MKDTCPLIYCGDRGREAGRPNVPGPDIHDTYIIYV